MGGRRWTGEKEPRFKNGGQQPGEERDKQTRAKSQRVGFGPQSGSFFRETDTPSQAI